VTTVTPVLTEDCPGCAGCDRLAWARLVSYIASWDRHLIDCENQDHNITVPMDELVTILNLSAEALAAALFTAASATMEAGVS
jgi:hypothetical protein